MNDFLKRAGSMGIIFLFVLIVLGFCIYIVATGGGILSYVITGIFVVLAVYLYTQVRKKFRKK